jgi:hypothetical protein
MTNHAKPRKRSLTRSRLADRDKSRLFVYHFFTFLMRIERLRRELYDNDLDMAVVSDAISIATIEPMMRGPDVREEFLSLRTVIGMENQRGVNALSIAQATGIARETTRRKIKKLIKEGVVAETRDGHYVIKPGFAQQANVLGLLDQAMDETVTFFNACLEKSLLVLEDE